jgi:hypothetical protein
MDEPTTLMLTLLTSMALLGLQALRLVQLDVRASAFGCFGAAIGAAGVGVAWIIASWHQPETWRYSLGYNECLANGRSKTFCDEVTEKARKEFETKCLEEHKVKGENDVGKQLGEIFCHDPSAHYI